MTMRRIQQTGLGIMTSLAMAAGLGVGSVPVADRSATAVAIKHDTLKNSIANVR